MQQAHTPTRSLPLAGATNFRDLGGYVGHGGQTVKWRRIFRSDHLAGLTPEDQALLADLGVARAVDFRGQAESAAYAYALPGVAYHPLHIEPTVVQRALELQRTGRQLTAQDAVDLMQDTYRGFVHDNAPRFAELFRLLLASDAPTVFHCTAGKDRTGVAAMLILLALGASDETICADYARTNLCRAAEIEKAMADHAAEIAADPAQRMRWQSSAGVDPETAPFVLRTIRQDYGSAESYLEAEYGLTPARLMRLRRMYLE